MPSTSRGAVNIVRICELYSEAWMHPRPNSIVTAARQAMKKVMEERKEEKYSLGSE